MTWDVNSVGVSQLRLISLGRSEALYLSRSDILSSSSYVTMYNKQNLHRLKNLGLLEIFGDSCSSLLEHY